MTGSIFRFFLFSNLFIAACAVLMTAQTSQLIMHHQTEPVFLWFIFCASITSYSFHWWLSTDPDQESIRGKWQTRYGIIHPLMLVAGGIGAAFTGWQLLSHWPWLVFIAFLTFLYSAPKIPLPLFRGLRRIAVGKTIYLTTVWTFVTTALPVLVADAPWTPAFLLFLGNRFFLIYAICWIFDLRDLEHDRAQGIRSLGTLLPLRWMDRVFYLSILLSAITGFRMLAYGQSALAVFFLLIPGVITALLYRPSSRNHSDLLYYFVLDGLMALSSLLTLVLLPVSG